MINQYLIIFTLGPVQSFIAEARRTADLYAGSQLLVRLARSMAQSLKNSGGTLIYPASDDLENVDMPHKLVGIVEHPQTAAAQAEKAMVEQWQAFGQDALGKLIDSKDETLQKIWQRQLNHHLEFYWAAAPYNGTDEGYIKAYQQIDRALGARKQSRNFAQASEDGFKDSLSGERSALRTGNDKDAREYWERMQRHYPRQLQEGELLDTMGVIKRFGLTKPAPSTSTVSVASFAKECKKQGLLTNLIQAIEQFNRKVAQNGLEFEGLDQAQIEKMCHQQNKGYFYRVGDWGRGFDFDFDGDLFYPETYTPQNLRTRYNITQDVYEKHEAALKHITDALATLYDKAGIKRPSPYYAILQMDGDLMGKHVSYCKGKDDHQKLSRDLGEFTKQAAELVGKHHGYLIYAGGDDVLAMFPVDTALTAADELASAYEHQFATWDQQDDGKPFPFTASAGIAFAHHLYPLDGALSAARQAEKQAKKEYGRNALCVTVLRRSGETSTVGGKWQVENSVINTVNMVNQLKTLLETNEISSRFPYSVIRDAEVVTKLDSDGRKAILKQTLSRHLHRIDENNRRNEIGNNGVSIEDWLAWANHHNQWTSIDPDMPDKQIHNQGYVELARWLIVARWLAAGGQE